MSILEKLYSESVFGVEKIEGGRFQIHEACDEYFFVNLTKEEMVSLGEEIIALANSTDK